MKRLRRLLCVLLCVLLCLSQLSPAVSRGEGTVPEIRVLLRRLALTDRANLTFSGLYAAVCQGTEVAIPDGTRAVLQIREGQLYLTLSGVTLRAGQKVVFRRYASTARETGIRFGSGGNLYPGDLAFTVENGILRPVLTLAVEDYLQGVLPYEMGEAFPLEALKAQAVCARTYALSHRHPERDYDVVDNTNDQVFRGVNADNVNCARAVSETCGIVGMTGGQLATCYYAASNGGQTMLPSQVWGSGQNDSCYAVADDPYDVENPESVVKRARLGKNAGNLPDGLVTLIWEKMQPEIRRQGFEDTNAENFRIDRITAVVLKSPRNGAGSRLMTEIGITFAWSGRRVVTTREGDEEDLYVYSTPEPTAVPGEPAAVRLTPFLEAGGDSTVTLPLFSGLLEELKLSIYGANNEIVTLREEDQSFVLEARRFGHGVGMSQRGAQWMAGRYGMTFDRILAFYYPGMQLMVGGTARAALPTPPGVLFNTPGPAASPTPRPTLMPVTGTLPPGGWLASVEGVADDSSLNLRAEPNGAGEILMRLYKHQRLMVLETCEDPAWVHVRTDAVEGYVMVSFLEKVE